MRRGRRVNAQTAGCLEIGRLLTPKQVSFVLRVHINTVYKMAKNGSLEGFRIGSSIRITENSLREYLEINRVELDLDA